MQQSYTGYRWARLCSDVGRYDPLMAGSIDGTDTVPHDGGIVRAISAKYKPNKQVTGRPEATIFIAKLNHITNEDTLCEAFSKYGKIVHCRIVRDIVTRRSKGYAFIEFKHRSDAEDAEQIFVDMECERSLPGWKPRRLGGGFGGKKESGQLRFGGKDRPFRKPIVLGTNSLQRGKQEGEIHGTNNRRTFSEQYRSGRDSIRHYKSHSYDRKHRSRSR
ncbi:U11/U12 small nuclear ribonucleoprotein 35 kDa protein-like isoform X2 [Dysidea avara]|uniref:U11/U12 small nuclear ribonucleoprotein 35 kDa protein-like isoform X2 n=1 Tax=Dysidea avara TaxID=196820 RepID=UPI00332FE986